MNYTTNFNLNKPEGTDLYNHLTIDNPNMDIIDGQMQANKLASIGAATELVSGSVHAITRSDINQNIFKFKATGDFNAGDTITVDGVSVNAYTTGGQQLTDKAYVLSAQVICILDGTSLWVLTNNVVEDINNVTTAEEITVTISSFPAQGIASVQLPYFTIPSGKHVIGFTVYSDAGVPALFQVLYVGGGNYQLYAQSLSFAAHTDLPVKIRPLFADASV